MRALGLLSVIRKQQICAQQDSKLETTCARGREVAVQMAKRYLVWLDLLGFDERVEEIAKYTHQRDSSKIRAELVDVIRERVQLVESKGEIIGKAYENDKWILVIDSLNLVFKVITEILDHNTGYENYEKIPLEIAIGVAEYDEWARFEGPLLVFQKPTIEFLKTYITDHYRKSFKQKHKGKSPKSTFVVLTKSMYDELEPFDKKMCQKFQYGYKKDSGKEESITFFVANLDKVQQRGKIYDFLEKIKRPNSRLYDRIDELYVPPVEYEEIKKTLEKERIVFITGTREFGKTYSAIRLLWEYFDRGYEPVWIEGGEEWERRNVRKRLEEIDRELNPRQVIYFEDPFGKTKYESRESLEREIGTIIDSIRNVEDVYVIITSREEVFKEFEKERLSSTEIKNFEKRVNIKRPSYDRARRRKMLLLWAESKNCRWLEEAHLRNVVLKKLRKRRNLPTPLSIRNFVISTIATTEEKELIEKIEEKSKETARSFADEIENMQCDKVLFLSSLFVFKLVRINLARKIYEKLVDELDIREPLEFEKVLNWFKDDKLDVSKKNIRFSHPSYYEALNYLLVKDGSPTRINKDIFSKVLLNLSEIDETKKRVPRFVASNFEKLPEDTRNLLFKMAEMKETANVSLQIITAHFHKFPKNLVVLLPKLAEREETAKAVGWALAINFNKLPEDLRNELLSRLSKKAEAAIPVACIIADHFDKIPSHYKDLLFKLSENEEAVVQIIWRLVVNFDRLPRDFKDLLFKLARSEETARAVARALGLNFRVVHGKGKDLLDELQDHLQQIVVNLSKSNRKKDRRRALLIISNTRSKIPKDFALSILDRLVEDESASIKRRAQKLMDEMR